MALSIDGVELTSLTVDGTEVDTFSINGTEVYSASKIEVIDSSATENYLIGGSFPDAVAGDIIFTFASRDSSDNINPVVGWTTIRQTPNTLLAYKVIVDGQAYDYVTEYDDLLINAVVIRGANTSFSKNLTTSSGTSFVLTDPISPTSKSFILAFIQINEETTITWDSPYVKIIDAASDGWAVKLSSAYSYPYTTDTLNKGASFGTSSDISANVLTLYPL